MENVLVGLSDARVEIINTLALCASIAMVIIAFMALKNWQRQDKAKREAEFLNSLIETSHAYIVEIYKSISFIRLVKNGMESYAPTWEKGEPSEIAIKGAIDYIKKNGKEDGKRLQEMSAAVQPSMISLSSLAVKGKIFQFENYGKCEDAISMLIAQLNKADALIVMISFSSMNWENSSVLENLRIVMDIDPEEMKKSIQESHKNLISFCIQQYKSIYG